MKAKRSGFTIIETVLVFAISGALTAALLVGISAQVNRQRYTDTTASMITFFQDQYSRVLNVQNANQERNPQSCSVTDVIEFSPTPANSGTSECLLMGRKLTITKDTVSAEPVIGGIPAKNARFVPSNDIEAFKSYVYSEDTTDILPNDSETYQPEWGASLTPRISSSSDVSAGLLTTRSTITLYILRSPLSGTTYTFISDSPTSSISSVISSQQTLKNSFLMCMNSQDATAGVTQALTVSPGASNSDAVVVRLSEKGQC